MSAPRPSAAPPDTGVESTDAPGGRDAGGGGRPGEPVERALIAIGLALLLGALMNADSLADTAERQPFGWQRSTAVTLVRPLEAVADATGAGRLNAWLTDDIGGWFRQAPGRGDGLAAGQPGTGTAPPPTEDGADAEGAPPDADAVDRGPTDEHPVVDGPGTEQDPAEDLGPRREPTAEDPLEVWLTGDSLVEALGAPLDEALSDAVPTVVRTDPNYATGLARPDYFDWHAYAEESVAEDDPDVVVVMMGGNDGQDIRDADGDVLRHDDAAWEEEYRRRAVGLLERLATDQRDVFWIGMPIMQDPDLDDRMRRIDEIYAEATTAHPRAEHVPTRDLFTVDGGYASYMDLPDGSVERVRRDDGLHFTFAGGRLLVERRLGEVITDRWAPEP